MHHNCFPLFSAAPPKYSLETDYLKAEAGSSPTLTFTVTSDCLLAESTEQTLRKSDGTIATKRFKVESNRVTFRKIGEQGISDVNEYSTNRIEEARRLKVESFLVTFCNVRVEDSGMYTISCCSEEGDVGQATLELDITHAQLQSASKSLCILA